MSDRHPRPRGRITLLVAGLIIGTFMVSPAGADFRKSINHILSHANPRFLNDCDRLGNQNDRLQQVLAQATVDQTLTTGSGYSGDGLIGSTDCVMGGLSAEVKDMGTGITRVAFPTWWTDPSFLDDLVLAAVTPMAADASASYTIEADTNGTVMEVRVRNGAGSLVDATFHVVVTGWEFGPCTGCRGDHPKLAAVSGYSAR